MESCEVKIKIFPEFGDSFIVILRIPADEIDGFAGECDFIEDWVNENLKNAQEWDFAD